MPQSPEQPSHTLRERLGAAAMTAVLLVGSAEGVHAIEVQEAEEERQDQTVAALTVPEATEAEQQWQQVRQQGIESIQNTQSSIGNEGVAELCEALEQYDLTASAEALAAISGIPAEILLEQGRVRRMQFFGNNGWEEFRNRTSIPKNARGIARPGGVLNFPASSFFVEGPTIQEQLETTIDHEFAHILSFREMDDGVGVPWHHQDDIPATLVEGTAEWLALRMFQEKHETTAKAYSYHSGGTMNAYLLSRLVGEQKLAQSFLTQNGAAIRNAINKRFGRSGAFEGIINPRGPVFREQRSSENSTSAPLFAGEDPTTLFALLKMMQDHNTLFAQNKTTAGVNPMPYEQWIDDAADIGVTEYTTVMTETVSQDTGSPSGSEQIEKDVVRGLFSITPHETAVAIRGLLDVPPTNEIPVGFRLYFYPETQSDPPVFNVVDDNMIERLGAVMATMAQQRPDAQQIIPIDITQTIRVRRALQQYRATVIEEFHNEQARSAAQENLARALQYQAEQTRDDIRAAIAEARETEQHARE